MPRFLSATLRLTGSNMRCLPCVVVHPVFEYGTSSVSTASMGLLPKRKLQTSVRLKGMPNGIPKGILPSASTPVQSRPTIMFDLSLKDRNTSWGVRKISGSGVWLEAKSGVSTTSSDKYTAISNKRSYVIGGVHGCATAISLCAYPGSFEQFFLTTDPTMPTIAAAMVGVAGIVSALVHRKLVASPGDTGRISPMQGMFIGGMTVFGMHIIVPSVVLAVPALLDYGTMCADPAQWLQTLPMDVAAYGWSLSWWSLVNLGMFSLPAGAASGILLSWPTSALLRSVDLADGSAA
eukprot:m.131690 g.131690  ORF g.131690 m.131690 type:complete len:292 (-) comp17478_c0_seq1:263-1138(-)